MQRILVVGPCGAGKSTLATRLGELLDLPVVHLDKLNWEPGWAMAADPLFRARLADALRQPRWIIDGNYHSTFGLRVARADTVVFLDLPRRLCLWRVLRRIAQHSGSVRPDMGEGCPEKLDWEFLEFVWNFHDDYRPRLLQHLAALPRDTRLIVLKSPSDVERFVRELDGRENKFVRDTY